MAAADVGTPRAPGKPCARRVSAAPTPGLSGVSRSPSRPTAAPLRRPDHPRARGRSQIRRFFRGVRAAGVGERSAEILETEVCGTLAYGIGTLALGAPAGYKGVFLGVDRRQEDRSLKMVIGMFSRDQAASCPRLCPIPPRATTRQDRVARVAVEAGASMAWDGHPEAHDRGER